MKSNSTTKSAANGGGTGASPRSPRIGSLTKVSDISRELRRIYRLSRCGNLDTVDLGRLANTLQILVSILKTSDLESRIEALEKVSHAQP
jgi:hypothetical protein